MTKLKTYTGAEVRELRRKHGVRQFEFWKCFHVTQSRGCRYELGREIPATVQLLLNIAFSPQPKSTACVEALRALTKPRKKEKQKPTRIPAAFGFLP